MRLNGFKLPVEHFSATSLAKAIQCPEKWRRRYLLHEREAIGPDAFIGSIDHETIACNFRWKMDTGRDLALESLDGIYNSVWEKGVELEEPLWGSVSPADTRELGRAMVQVYRENVAPTVSPIAVERRFEETIPGVPLPVIGYLDVETHESVIERKTAATKLSKPKPLWKLQGRIYQLATDKPVQWQITTKQKTPQTVTCEQTPGLMMERANPDQTVRLIQTTVEMINDLYRRYGADETWPMNGVFHDWLCQYCSYQTTCPIWSQT